MCLSLSFPNQSKISSLPTSQRQLDFVFFQATACLKATKNIWLCLIYKSCGIAFTWITTTTNETQFDHCTVTVHEKKLSKNIQNWFSVSDSGTLISSPCHCSLASEFYCPSFRIVHMFVLQIATLSAIKETHADLTLHRPHIKRGWRQMQHMH